MRKHKWLRLVAACLAIVILIGSVAAATLNYDLNGDGKTNIWDLQMALNGGVSEADQKAALNEALGGGDELHKNAEGQWEIWTTLGLYNMAKNAQSGDTFVLMQDIDMDGAGWTPVENFSGKLIADMHTISNMKITKDVDGNMGFFASIADGGYVEYLNLKDMNVIASDAAVNIGLVSGTCSGKIFGSTAVGFITDERTTLPETVYVGGMVGKMLDGGSIESIDNNKLPEEGVEQTIHTISAKIGTRFAVSEGHVVGIVGDGTEAVDSGTLLQDLTGTMPDPQAIAWVQNGDVMAFPLDLTSMLALIQADGNTVITLQENLSHTAAITIPYSCTVDCNGYRIATPETKNNGLQITAAGTENKTFTLKNGTLTHYEIGVRVNAGAVVISNMTIISNAGAPIGLYDATDYSAINRIEGSTLVSKNWGCIVYNGKNLDMSAAGITVENSNLIAAKPAGNAIFIKNLASTAGTVTLGSNVNLYTYGSAVAASSVTLAGVDPVKLEDLQTVTVDGLTYSGLSYWTTDEAVISTEVIAEVTNGTETVQVTNTKDMLASVSSAGTTKIKLVKDITATVVLTFPYSCEIDLNGFSITNSSSNAVWFSGVGSENTVARIKNGTINHGVIGVRVDTGSIDLSNVQINGIGACGASVGFYDPSGDYRADNKIDGCSIYNPNYVNIMFYGTDVEFKDTGVSISNTTLVAAKNYNFGVTTERMSGIVDLGSGVEIYCPKAQINNGALYRFLGKLAYRPESGTVSVTVNGHTVSGMNHWSTDCEKEVVNILLIGNSLSTTIPQELYNIATNAGYCVNVANIYYPGCKSWQHWEWLNNDTANYQYRHHSEMGGYIRRGDMSTSKYALNDLDWDVIVYQDWFMPNDAADLDMLYQYHQADAYNMMQYLKTNYPNAKHYYYQHWAWAVGREGTETVEAQEAMWQMINTASTKFANDNDFILIPCGEAYELARDDERIGDTLCQSDKLHDDGPGGGQYLNGCVFFETIFQESCIGDTWRASNGPSEEKHQILQEIAHATVAKIHGENWVTE